MGCDCEKPRIVRGLCDVCGRSVESEYCAVCKAFICKDCERNWPKRALAAAMKYGLIKRGRYGNG